MPLGSGDAFLYLRFVIACDEHCAGDGGKPRLWRMGGHLRVPTVAMTVLHRLLHCALVFLTKGNNYRLRAHAVDPAHIGGRIFRIPVSSAPRRPGQP